MILLLILALLAPPLPQPCEVYQADGDLVVAGSALATTGADVYADPRAAIAAGALDLLPVGTATLTEPVHLDPPVVRVAASPGPLTLYLCPSGARPIAPRMTLPLVLGG